MGRLQMPWDNFCQETVPTAFMASALPYTCGMSPSKKSTSTESNPDFDHRMAELEGIAAALEGGDLGLEQALERYKRGVSLLRSCRTELEGFRSQVEELAREGAPQSRPLDADPDFTQ